jgi:hypothetical protein
MKESKICLICNTPFETYQKSLCCSKSCARSYYQKGSKNPAWKGGRYIDKLGTRKETVYILDREHPSSDKRGYVSESRYVMEKHLKRILSMEEIVHHIDGNRLNNRLDNLRVMLHGEHTTMHNLMRHQH